MESNWKRTDARSNSRTRRSQFNSGVFARGASSSSSQNLQFNSGVFARGASSSSSQNLQPGSSSSQNPQPGGPSSPYPQPGPNVPAEVKMAYEDAWKVCNPDFKTPFTSLEDACERLLPYHVVADYEGEEEEQYLASDSTGHMLSRSQQWDNTLSAKVAEFNATFGKQIGTFNALTGMHTEERMMVEQMLLQQERQALLRERAEFESKQKMAAEEQSRAAAAAAAAANAEMFVRSQNASTSVEDKNQLDEADEDAFERFLKDLETDGDAK